MPLFFKRQLLKKFKQKGEKLIFDADKALEDSVLQPEELKELKSETKQLTALYAILFPPSLPWKTKFLRVGLIVLIFGALGGGSYILLKNPPSIQTSTTKTIQGEAKEYAFIPHTKVFVSPTSVLQRQSYSSPLLVAEGKGWEGFELVGLTGDAQNLVLLTIEPRGEKRVLMARRFNQELILQGTPRELFQDASFGSGAFAKLPSGWLVALITNNPEDPIQLLRFNGSWELEGNPVFVNHLFPQETTQGAALGILNDTVALVTLKVPLSTASALERAAPILRAFSLDSLVLQKEDILPPSPQLTFSPGASFLGNPDGSFEIILAGHPSLQAPGTIIKGDELYVLSYTPEKNLKEVFQITNNGRPHDFSPLSIIKVKDLFILGFLNITGLPQKPEDPLGYPPFSGRALVMALGKGWSVEGGLVTFDAPPRFNPEEQTQEGVENTLIYYLGNRLVSAHLIQRRTPGESQPETSHIVLQWQQIAL